MKYDRLTRLLKVEVEGAEYSLKLTNSMLEELEDELPKGDTLISMIMNRETPRMKVLRKAFCIGLCKDSEKVRGAAADAVYEKFFQHYGVQETISVFYALIAASQLLGAVASNEILKNIGLVPKDAEDEQIKNA